ncbi:MAG: thioesterase family protein [Bacteroidales bacterium]|nr:thioesterase family protein [Bacteroidales bacterium]
MATNIPIGLKGKHSEKVTKKNTALSMGSGSLEVFATPALVALMEQCCMKSLRTFLPEGYTSVGSEVNVKHIRPSALGDDIHCESEVIAVEDRKISFEVSAWDDQVLIGHGTHIRYIVDIEKFMSRL